MEILVDDQTYELSGSPEQTVQDLADEVCHDESGQSKRIVISIACDGQALNQDQLSGVLDKPLNTFDRIELRTQDPRALAAATIKQTIELFENSMNMRHEIADRLDEGRLDAAMPLLQQLINVWKQVQQSMQVCATATNIDFATLKVGDEAMEDVLDVVKTHLNELKDAMENRDLVLVGDILRYEFQAPLENWLSILKQLEKDISIQLA
jgi:hypothetical protein